MNTRLLSFFIWSLFFAGSTLEAKDTKCDIQLQWEKTPGASMYEIEVASDQDFRHILVTKITAKNWIDWNSRNPGISYKKRK